MRTRIEKKFDDFIGGDVEHAAEMVSALWKVINGDGAIEPPSSILSAVSPLWDSHSIHKWSFHPIRPHGSRVRPTGTL